jgi:hypothetical protein
MTEAIACGPQPSAAQKAMKIVDVLLAAHASQFRMHDNTSPATLTPPNRLVDPAGFLQKVGELEKAYLAPVAKEKAAK